MSTQQVIGNYICNHCILPSSLSGGDITEIFKITEEQYGLYLLDIAGHGQTITNTVTQIKKLLIELANSQQSLEYITNPGSLVKQLNLLLRARKIFKYLTLLYGVLDLNKNCFNYTIAGHYPNPILLDTQQHAKYLPGKGIPLGILENSQFETYSIPLEINNTIIVFSDGIIKSSMLNFAIEDRINYLLELTSRTNADLNAIAQQLNLGFTTNNIKDDIIITTLKRTS